MEPINRKLLKNNAKIALKNNFWMIMLVAFVGTLLGANWTGLLNGGSGSTGNYDFSDSDTYDTDDVYGSSASSASVTLEMLEDEINDVLNSDFDYSYDSTKSVDENMNAFGNELLDYFNIDEAKLIQTICFAIAAVLLIAVVVSVIVTCIQFVIGSFISAPVGVGYRKYFMLNRRMEAKFSDLFAAFSGGKYMKVVKAMFTTNIRIFGWSMLFYFPGLVKFYQYFFVPYIVAENPDITPERAREISRQMTDGHKWQIFVLELSFLGWAMVFVAEEFVLALISCGLLAIPGVVLIYPLVGYEATTYAELYAERREYALVTGMATSNELIGFWGENKVGQNGSNNDGINQA